MDRQLKRHAQSKGSIDQHIAASATRRPAKELELRIQISGDLKNLKIPAFETIRRGDQLWENTCFELFVGAKDAKTYYEFNIAPNGEWAAYAFDDYRTGMRPLESIKAPSIDVQASSNQFNLVAALDLQALPMVTDTEDWHVGISAILEETGDAKSYWALAHPTGKPDFHHSDCFVLELGAEERS